jgi:hypothetical protein
MDKGRKPSNSVYYKSWWQYLCLKRLFYYKLTNNKIELETDFIVYFEHAYFLQLIPVAYQHLLKPKFKTLSLPDKSGKLSPVLGPLKIIVVHTKETLVLLHCILSTPLCPTVHNIAQAVSRWSPPRRSDFSIRSVRVGFVVDLVTLGLVFSKDLSFRCQFSFHQLLHIH